jgi:hypothetical protein
MKPGQPRRYDDEYERNGTANLFMMFAPPEGWRCVKVTDRHAAVDYARVLKELSDVRFPDAEKIVLVQDNLSTHTPAARYEAFPADEARRLVERFHSLKDVETAHYLGWTTKLAVSAVYKLERAAPASGPASALQKAIQGPIPP